MEAESPDDRPESPKKKIRPSSTTNSESNSDNYDSTDAVEPSENHSAEMNGLAPTRRGREAVARKNDANNSSNDQGSIQEEVVSSTENTVPNRKQLPSENDGVDSLTNEVGDSNNHEAASVTYSSCDIEAEKQER